MNCHITGILVVLNAMALSATVFSYSVNAQQLNNFVDFNQSRQFFEEGNKIIEREIKWLGKNLELPTIKLIKDTEQPQFINNSYFIDRQLTLKPISQAQRDN